MNLSKCIGWFCLTLAAFFLCLVLFPSCVRSVEPELRVDVKIDHHTAELKKYKLEDIQARYGSAMLFIDMKTLVTIPAGMEITAGFVIGTELVVNWIEYDPANGKQSAKLERLIVEKDSVWSIGE
jgi:hypothetical protein